MSGDGVDHYDLQRVRDELQRSIWDLQSRLDRMEADMSQRIRDGYRDTHDGLAEVGGRVSALESAMSREAV